MSKQKIKDIIVFHKYTTINANHKKAFVLLDMNNTFFNIKNYIKEKYPKVPIEIVNEGMGDR